MKMFYLCIHIITKFQNLILMRKILLFLSALSLLGCVQAFAAPVDTLIYVNYASNSANWTTTGVNDTFSVNGYQVVAGAVSSVNATRAKNNCIGAIKCNSVTFASVPSVGSASFTFQNGSGSATGNFKVQVSSDNGATWITTDSVDVAGNGTVTYSPTNIVSKSAVNMRLLFPWVTWFYAGVITKSQTVDGAPAVLSISPADGEYLHAKGEIKVVYDELIKLGTGTITLPGASVDSTKIVGNTLSICYSNFADPSTLTIPASVVTDLEGNAMAADKIVTYVVDHVAPNFVSITPTDGSQIHIQDLGEQARYIKVLFDEDVKIADASGITLNNGTANGTLKPSVSDDTLIVRYSGLSYNSTYLLNIASGAITDLSDNVFAGKSFTFTTGARDAVAPKLTAQSVADKATAQPISNGISFTFDEIIKVAAQTATANGKAVKLSNNGKVIGLNYTQMPYDSKVVVILPEGCITDTCGNAAIADTLTFTTESKAAAAFDAIVDGSIDASANGTYKTIQEACNAASGTSRFKIFVKPGIYKEKLVVAKDNISLVGQNPDSVIISWNECASTSTLQSGTYATGIPNIGTDASYSMLILGNNFYGENFTVRNDFDYTNNNTVANRQAVALEHLNGDKSVLKNIKMIGFQDTYYPKGEALREYLKNCTIQGGTDFIFGSGTCFIDSSAIKCVETGYHITACSGTAKEFGVVFNACNVTKADTVIYDNPTDAAAGTNKHTQFDLGRIWKDYASTSYINCKFEGGLINDAGWAPMSGDTLTAKYHEYNSTTLEGVALNVSKRASFSSQLTAEEATRYDYDNAFNYGAGNVWNPLQVSAEPAKIAAAHVSNGKDSSFVSWDESAFATGYIVYKNNKFFATTANTYVLDTAYLANDVYSIAAYNLYGATSEALTAIPTGIKNVTIKNGFLENTLIENQVNLKNPENFMTVEIIDANGALMLKSLVNGSSINVSSLPKGMFIAKGVANDGTVYIDKIVKK